MSRLPVPGQDKGTWGGILNDYLLESHAADGTLKPNSVGPEQLTSVVQTSLGKADNALQVAPVSSVAGRTGIITITSADVTDATTVGKSVLLAADAVSARSAMGAGTSNIAIGTTSTTAAAGDDSRIVNAVAKDSLFINVKDHGATGDGTTDDTAAISSSIATAGSGGTVYFPSGTYRITSTLTLNIDRVYVRGSGATILMDATNTPAFRVLNASFCEIGEGLYFDGQWRTGATAIDLRGALHTKVKIRGDRWPVGVTLIATAASSATQNSSFNDLDIEILNGIKGISFQGDGTYYASNNTISRFVWAGAGSTVSTGIDFQAYTDNNTFEVAIINLNFAGSIGVVYNSQTPASDVEVYENHFLFLVAEAQITGTTSIKGNRTWQTPGMFPSRVTLRPSGIQPPTPSIASNCDIQFINTNDGVGNLSGRPGISQVMVSAIDMVSAAGSPTLGADWSCPIWTCVEGAIASLRFSALIPPEWRQFKTTLLWAPSNGVGGNVYFSIDQAQLGSGFDISDGAVTNTLGAAGINSNRVVSTDLVTTTVPAGTTMMWAKLTRDGTQGTDSATCDVRIVAVILTRTL